MKSNVIDFHSLTANMYGCEPCPKCRKKCRYPAKYDPRNKSKSQDLGTLRIFCDDCGFVEEGEEKRDE